MRNVVLRFAGVWVAMAFGALSAAAGSELPDCVDSSGRPMPVDNEKVIEWKTSTPNAWQGRAYVRGPVVRMFADRNGHDHFEISLSTRPADVLEVVYNSHFGALPEIRLGMDVMACGDYITSVQQTGPYPPSPSGAIIHWVHFNPRGGHPHGFVVIDGVLYGDQTGNVPPRRGGRGSGNSR